MAKISKMTATIRSVSYHRIEPQGEEEQAKHYSRLELNCFYDIYGENIDQVQYYADLELNENKSGKPKKKNLKEVWKCTLYIDEETYDMQRIDNGDIIEINDVKITTDNFKMSVYDKEKLKNYPNEKIKNKYLSTYKCQVKDKTDMCSKCKHKKACAEKENYIQPHATIPIISARLSCKENNWKIKYKFDEITFMKVGKVKFAVESIKEFDVFDGFENYISKESYEKLLPLNCTETKLKCYNKKIKLKEYDVLVELEYRKDIDKYWLEVIKI